MNWLLLIHQIPAKPSYFRAKIWRRLQQVGAVPIKQAVYVMPDQAQTNEDLSWIAKEIIEGNGEAVLLRAHFLEGLNNDQVVQLFQKARKADYAKILQEAKDLLEQWQEKDKASNITLLDCKSNLSKLRKDFFTLSSIDFFPGPEQGQTEAFLAEMEIIFRQQSTDTPATCTQENSRALEGKTWVTRKNIYVDRMASAWFIRRFIDPDAPIKFVTGSRYTAKEKEIRFDMPEAEYTHQGDMCTFEVLTKTFTNHDPALKQLAKIIHDIDLKDEAYGLTETAGLHALFDGIVATTNKDLERIDQASVILDGMLTFFSNK